MQSLKGRMYMSYCLPEEWTKATHTSRRNVLFPSISCGRIFYQQRQQGKLKLKHVSLFAVLSLIWYSYMYQSVSDADLISRIYQCISECHGPSAQVKVKVKERTKKQSCYVKKKIKKIKKNHTEMRQKDKNNLRKSPEGARKYVGSDVREGTCFPGKLVRNK